VKTIKTTGWNYVRLYGCMAKVHERGFELWLLAE